MKKILAFSFIFIALSCGHQRIRLVDHEKHTHEELTKERSESATQEDLSLTRFIDNEDVVRSPEVNSEITEITRTERMIDGLRTFEKKQLDQTTLSQDLEEITSKLSKHPSDEGSGNKDLSNLGKAFLIIGGIMTVFSLIFFIKSLNTTDDGTAAGCITSIFNSIAAIYLGVVFGILALVFILIGVILVVQFRDRANTP